MRRILLIGFLIVGLALLLAGGWWWLDRPQPSSLRVVMRGPSGSNDSLGVTGGNLFVVAPEPGVFFGTVRKPDEPEQFTYVILFKYDARNSPGSARSLQFESSTHGHTAETNNAIELLGKKIEANYHIELNEARTTTANEQLTVGGKEVDISLGKLFVIDLSEQATVYRQKDVKLPAISSRLESPQDVEQLVHEIRTTLDGQDPDIVPFLR